MVPEQLLFIEIESNRGPSLLNMIRMSAMHVMAKAKKLLSVVLLHYFLGMDLPRTLHEAIERAFGRISLFHEWFVETCLVSDLVIHPFIAPQTFLLPVADNADCDTLAQNGFRYQDGIYNIRPGTGPSFKVYCDMSTEGWAVIQRRWDASVDFDRHWLEYKEGFGEPEFGKNYWIGLDNLYRLTNQRRYNK
jgi:hypothetical protein